MRKLILTCLFFIAGNLVFGQAVTFGQSTNYPSICYQASSATLSGCTSPVRHYSVNLGDVDIAIMQFRQYADYESHIMKTKDNLVMWIGYYNAITEVNIDFNGNFQYNDNGNKNISTDKKFKFYKIYFLLIMVSS